MPKKAKELSATEVRRLTKRGTYAVGGVSGLLLQVTADNGPRSWLLRYSTGQSRSTTSGARYAVRRDMGLGSYPEVSLGEARQRARELKALIRQGIDPLAEKRATVAARAAAEASAITFAEAARRCFDAKAPEFRNDKHREQWIASLERHVFPIIGRLPVSEVGIPHVRKVLEPIWHSHTETATRVRQRVESVLSWATVSGYRHGDNPARWRGNLKEVMPNPSKIAKPEHFPALPWQRLPDFMADLRTREGIGARALEFLILTAARSGEVRSATWDQIDLATRTWTVPGDRMKAGKTHRVPLSDAAVAVLQSLPCADEVGPVFPSQRGRKLSDMTVGQTIKRLDDASIAAGGEGYRDPASARVVVPHGFRSSFKDWARSSTSYADEVSELALAHVNSDATRAAYARDELMPQRTRLMSEWARFLAEARVSGEVVAIGDAASRA